MIPPHHDSQMSLNNIFLKNTKILWMSQELVWDEGKLYQRNEEFWYWGSGMGVLHRGFALEFGILDFLYIKLVSFHLKFP